MQSISNTLINVWLMVNLLTRIADLKTYSNPEFMRFYEVKPGTARRI